MSTEVIPLFPQLLVKAADCFDPAPVLKWALNFMGRDPKGRMLSNHLGWQQEVNLGADSDASEVLNPIIEAVGRAFDDGIGLQPGYCLGLDNLWVNISGRGAFNWDHLHPSAFYSGVAYLSVPEDSGHIRFMADSRDWWPDLFRDETKSKYNVYGCWNEYPEAGTILLFPPHMMHRVYPNMSDDQRVSVSFNLMIHKI